jgi:hypothetical protein
MAPTESMAGIIAMFANALALLIDFSSQLFTRQVLEVVVHLMPSLESMTPCITNPASWLFPIACSP